MGPTFEYALMILAQARRKFHENHRLEVGDDMTLQFY